MANERETLLKSVIKAHKNATKKVSRLKAKGVAIGNTRNDPRENLAAVRQMSSVQLRQYRMELGEFNSRGTAYVPGVKGAPLSKARFDEYKRLESKYNERLKRKIDGIKDVKIPGNDLTIGERYNKMVPKGRSISGASSRFHPYNRHSKGFPNNKALDAAIDDLQNRLVPGFQSQQDRKLRDNFEELMKFSGRPDVLKASQALTAEQFDILWSFDNMVSSIVENYAAVMDMLSGDDESMEREAINEVYDDILDKMKAIEKQKLFKRAKKHGTTPETMAKADLYEARGKVTDYMSGNIPWSSSVGRAFRATNADIAKMDAMDMRTLASQYRQGESRWSKSVAYALGMTAKNSKQRKR